MLACDDDQVRTLVTVILSLGDITAALQAHVAETERALKNPDVSPLYSHAAIALEPGLWLEL